MVDGTTRNTKPNGLYVFRYDIIKNNHQNYEIKQYFLCARRHIYQTDKDVTDIFTKG